MQRACLQKLGILPLQVDTLAAGFLQACQAWHKSCERIAVRLWHLGLHGDSAAAHVSMLADLLEGKIAAVLLDETRSVDSKSLAQLISPSYCQKNHLSVRCHAGNQ